MHDQQHLAVDPHPPPLMPQLQSLLGRQHYAQQSSVDAAGLKIFHEGQIVKWVLSG
jgi:hypothetical protein